MIVDVRAWRTGARTKGLFTEIVELLWTTLLTRSAESDLIGPADGLPNN